MLSNNTAFVCNHVDHTNLKKTATEADIIKLCNEAVKYGAKSVCVQPCYVPLAKKLLTDKEPMVCTVIGFPNGYNTTNVKKAETLDAILNGADEIDMVINNCWMKDGKHDEIKQEIQILANVCHNLDCSDKQITLKVIVETCLLSSEEIIRMCNICIEAGADYIKTSTGFDKEGARPADIELMHNVIGGRNLKIKASGGIRDVKSAYDFIMVGADRIGASSICVGDT